MTPQHTERLVLRAWTRDADDLAFLWDTYSRPEVHRYIGRVPRVMAAPEEALALVDRWSGLVDGVLGVRALTTHAGERLGSVLLKHIPWSVDAPEARDGVPEDVEIGWHLHPDAWGHGYATEAAASMLSAAHASGLTRIVAVTHPDNTASQRVCLRLGMSPSGETARYYDSVCALFEATAG